MADENENEESQGSSQSQGGGGDQQALDDLTVLSNVDDQSLKGATLNVVRPTEGGGAGLGNLAMANQGGTFTPTVAQKAAVNIGLEVGQETIGIDVTKKSGTSADGSSDGAQGAELQDAVAFGADTTLRAGAP